MTRAELIAVMAKKADISKASAAKALEAMLASITTTISNGGKVTLVGFGTFCIADRAARKGRNPQTGDAIDIPATRVPKFRAGAELKEACQ